MEELINWLRWLSPLSIVLSVVTGVLTYINFRRTNQYQQYEYKPRLQISNERPMLYASETEDQANRYKPVLRYSATLENKSGKPIQVNQVRIEYGAANDPHKRKGSTITPKFHLAGGDSRQLTWEVLRTLADSVVQEFGLSECMFVLVIEYEDVRGKLVRWSNPIIGYNEIGTIWLVNNLNPSI